MAGTKGNKEIARRYPVVDDPLRTEGIQMNQKPERGSYYSRRKKVGL